MNTQRCDRPESSATRSSWALPLMLESPMAVLLSSCSCTVSRRAPHCRLNGASGASAAPDARSRCPIIADLPSSGGSVCGSTARSEETAARPPRGSSSRNSQPCSMRSPPRAASPSHSGISTQPLAAAPSLRRAAWSGAGSSKRNAHVRSRTRTRE